MQGHPRYATKRRHVFCQIQAHSQGCMKVSLLRRCKDALIPCTCSLCIAGRMVGGHFLVLAKDILITLVHMSLQATGRARWLL